MVRLWLKESRESMLKARLLSLPIGRAINLEMLATYPVYRRDGAPDLGSSIVRPGMTLRHSMKPTRDSLIGGLYQRSSVMVSGGGLTWRSRCNAGSFQPGKVDVIPTRIHPLIPPAINGKSPVLCPPIQHPISNASQKKFQRLR